MNSDWSDPNSGRAMKPRQAPRSAVREIGSGFVSFPSGRYTTPRCARFLSLIDKQIKAP
jgi:hypothetical protein